MKYRKGFVTNSSSSSFVLIGRKVKRFDDIDFESKLYYAMGKEIYDGRDVFKVLPEMIDALKIIARQSTDLEIVETDAILYEPYGSKLTVSGESCVWSGNADFHNSNTLELLIENYGIQDYFIDEMSRQIKRLQSGEITPEEFKLFVEAENEK